MGSDVSMSISDDDIDGDSCSDHHHDDKELSHQLSLTGINKKQKNIDKHLHFGVKTVKIETLGYPSDSDGESSLNLSEFESNQY